MGLPLYTRIRTQPSGVGIACLGQELPENGVGDAFVANGNHEDIDIGAPKLPVRPVHGDDEVFALGDELEQKAAKRAKIKGIPTHKALNATLIRGRLGPPAQDQRQLRKTDGALHKKRQRKSRHELESCLMDREMLLQQVCERPIVLHGPGESCRWVFLSNELPSTALCWARSFFCRVQRGSG